jgi:hypothetical protein
VRVYTELCQINMISSIPGLHPGSVFKGHQRSGKNSYPVTVEIKHVDLATSYMCGHLSIGGLTQELPNLTTFFEAEIIGPKHSFETSKWSASHETDQRHWSKFQAFNHHMAAFASGSKAELAALASDLDHAFIFMRWKELFLVPDHTVRDIKGASFAGFYYCCYEAASCTLHGYYFHTGSELFQSLHLKPVTHLTSSSHKII